MWRLLLLAGLALPAHAVTLRYAVVVGSNGPHDGPLPRLQFAEREASELADALRTYAAFPDENLILLSDPDRADIGEAVHELARRKRADVRRIPGARTLFAFFFTGHGQPGRLLLSDDQLSAGDIGSLVREMGADFTLGFLDACYSGSLDLESLKAKGRGVEPTGNPFETLPEALLTAEGTMWFVSSGPDETSFEDTRVGGVFTHYFIRALSKAPRDGPAISVERLWSYARGKTRVHATSHNKAQNPRMLTSVKGQAFPYFSFPVPATSQLRFAAATQGRYVVSWADESISRTIVKQAGAPQTVPVFPGAAILRRFEEGKVVEERRLTLGRRPVTITSGGPPSAGIGSGQAQLFEKGSGYWQQEDAATVLLGVGYGIRPLLDATLSLEHQVRAGFRIDHGAWVVRFGPLYGASTRNYEAWSFEAHGAGGYATLGYGLELGKTRLAISAGLSAMAVWQAFGSGQSRKRAALEPEVTVDWLVPLAGPASLIVGLDGGLRYAPGLASGTTEQLSGFAGARLGVAFRVR